MTIRILGLVAVGLSILVAGDAVRAEPVTTTQGAPMQITLSTAPQSMPRSSVEVQTTARKAPLAIAASTLRRCSGDSEP